MDYSTTEKIMEQNTIPYYAHEGIVARMERANRRLWILCIVLIILLAGTNAAWIPMHAGVTLWAGTLPDAEGCLMMTAWWKSCAI